MLSYLEAFLIFIQWGFHLKCLSSVIACLPDGRQLEDCLVSKTISLCQVLKLPLTCCHNKSFWFQCLLGTWFPLIFFLIWLICNLFSLSTSPLSYCQERRRHGDLRFFLLECLILYHLTLLVPPSLDLWASSQEDLTQQFFYWPLCRVLLPGGRDAIQPAATEHLTLKVSSGLWIGKGLH